MSEFRAITPEKFDYSPFHMIGEEWMLITAEREDKVNTMTASWGGLGVIWNKNVVYIFVRDSRYTKEFIDHSDTFSLTFFPHKENAKMLGYMGSVSGRDENKVEKMGLTMKHYDGVPYFEEASVAMICKKLSRIPISPELMPEEIKKAYYAHEDYHDMYIGEIVQILQK
jgi:flavin reductase (DIM6/NTAB) family NADH-FMN oxidoreductase RutF